MSAKASIDRFEGDLAVLDVDGEEVRVPRSRLPPGAREGDAVDPQTLEMDPEETARLRDRVAAARARAKGNPFKGGKL